MDYSNYHYILSSIKHQQQVSSWHHSRTRVAPSFDADCLTHQHHRHLQHQRQQQYQHQHRLNVRSKSVRLPNSNNNNNGASRGTTGRQTSDGQQELEEALFSESAIRLKRSKTMMHRLHPIEANRDVVGSELTTGKSKSWFPKMSMKFVSSSSSVSTTKKPKPAESQEKSTNWLTNLYHRHESASTNKRRLHQENLGVHNEQKPSTSNSRKQDQKSTKAKIDNKNRDLTKQHRLDRDDNNNNGNNDNNDNNDNNNRSKLTRCKSIRLTSRADGGQRIGPYYLPPVDYEPDYPDNHQDDDQDAIGLDAASDKRHPPQSGQCKSSCAKMKYPRSVNECTPVDKHTQSCSQATVGAHNTHPAGYNTLDGRDALGDGGHEWPCDADDGEPVRLVVAATATAKLKNARPEWQANGDEWAQVSARHGIMNGFEELQKLKELPTATTTTTTSKITTTKPLVVAPDADEMDGDGDLHHRETGKSLNLHHGHYGHDAPIKVGHRQLPVAHHNKRDEASLNGGHQVARLKGEEEEEAEEQTTTTTTTIDNNKSININRVLVESESIYSEILDDPSSSAQPPPRRRAPPIPTGSVGSGGADDNWSSSGPEDLTDGGVTGTGVVAMKALRSMSWLNSQYILLNRSKSEPKLCPDLGEHIVHRMGGTEVAPIRMVPVGCCAPNNSSGDTNSANQAGTVGRLVCTVPEKRGSTVECKLVDAPFSGNRTSGSSLARCLQLSVANNNRWAHQANSNTSDSRWQSQSKTQSQSQSQFQSQSQSEQKDILLDENQVVVVVDGAKTTTTANSNQDTIKLLDNNNNNKDLIIFDSIISTTDANGRQSEQPDTLSESTIDKNTITNYDQSILKPHSSASLMSGPGDDLRQAKPVTPNETSHRDDLQLTTTAPATTTSGNNETNSNSGNNNNNNNNNSNSNSNNNNNHHHHHNRSRKSNCNNTKLSPIESSTLNDDHHSLEAGHHKRQFLAIADSNCRQEQPRDEAIHHHGIGGAIIQGASERPAISDNRDNKPTRPANEPNRRDNDQQQVDEDRCKVIKIIHGQTVVGYDDDDRQQERTSHRESGQDLLLANTDSPVEVEHPMGASCGQCLFDSGQLGVTLVTSGQREESGHCTRLRDNNNKPVSSARELVDNNLKDNDGHFYLNQHDAQLDQQQHHNHRQQQQHKHCIVNDNSSGYNDEIRKTTCCCINGNNGTSASNNNNNDNTRTKEDVGGARILANERRRIDDLMEAMDSISTAHSSVSKSLASHICCHHQATTTSSGQQLLESKTTTEILPVVDSRQAKEKQQQQQLIRRGHDDKLLVCDSCESQNLNEPDESELNIEPNDDQQDSEKERRHLVEDDHYFIYCNHHRQEENLNQEQVESSHHLVVDQWTESCIINNQTKNKNKNKTKRDDFTLGCQHHEQLHYHSPVRRSLCCTKSRKSDAASRIEQLESASLASSAIQHNDHSHNRPSSSQRRQPSTMEDHLTFYETAGVVTTSQHQAASLRTGSSFPASNTKHQQQQQQCNNKVSNKKDGGAKSSSLFSRLKNKLVKTTTSNANSNSNRKNQDNDVSQPARGESLAGHYGQKATSVTYGHNHLHKSKSSQFVASSNAHLYSDDDGANDNDNGVLRYAHDHTTRQDGHDKRRVSSKSVHNLWSASRLSLNRKSLYGPHEMRTLSGHDGKQQQEGAKKTNHLSKSSTLLNGFLTLTRRKKLNIRDSNQGGDGDDDDDLYLNSYKQPVVANQRHELIKPINKDKDGAKNENRLSKYSDESIPSASDSGLSCSQLNHSDDPSSSSPPIQAPLSHLAMGGQSRQQQIGNNNNNNHNHNRNNRNVSAKQPSLIYDRNVSLVGASEGSSLVFSSSSCSSSSSSSSQNDDNDLANFYRAHLHGHRDGRGHHQHQHQSINSHQDQINRLLFDQSGMLNIIGQARAIVDCDACAYDREALVFKKGDIIDILAKHESGTWIGMCHQRVGHFKFINVVQLTNTDTQWSSQHHEHHRHEQSGHQMTGSDEQYVTKLVVNGITTKTGQTGGNGGGGDGDGGGGGGGEYWQQDQNEPQPEDSEAGKDQDWTSLEHLLMAIGLANDQANSGAGDEHHDQVAQQYYTILTLNGFHDLDTFSQIRDVRLLKQLGITNEEHQRRLLIAANIVRQASSAAKLDFQRRQREMMQQQHQNQQQQQQQHLIKIEDHRVNERAAAMRNRKQEPIYANLIDMDCHASNSQDGANMMMRAPLYSPIVLPSEQQPQQQPVVLVGPSEGSQKLPDSNNLSGESLTSIPTDGYATCQRMPEASLQDVAANRVEIADEHQDRRHPDKSSTITIMDELLKKLVATTRAVDRQAHLHIGGSHQQQAVYGTIVDTKSKRSSPVAHQDGTISMKDCRLVLPMVNTTDNLNNHHLDDDDYHNADKSRESPASSTNDNNSSIFNLYPLTSDAPPPPPPPPQTTTTTTTGRDGDQQQQQQVVSNLELEHIRLAQSRLVDQKTSTSLAAYLNVHPHPHAHNSDPYHQIVLDEQNHLDNIVYRRNQQPGASVRPVTVHYDCVSVYRDTNADKCTTNIQQVDVDASDYMPVGQMSKTRPNSRSASRMSTRSLVSAKSNSKSAYDLRFDLSNFFG